MGTRKFPLRRRPSDPDGRVGSDRAYARGAGRLARPGAEQAGGLALAGLLLGLYIPTEGRILYDGNDLSQLDLRSVRRQMGIVPQNPYLFGASIRSNIAIADPNLYLNP